MSKMKGLTPHMIAADFIETTCPDLSILNQARILGISRSSVYYLPVEPDVQTLDLMHRIDKIHTDWPVYGARKIAAQLARDTGLQVGRKRARTLMEQMAISAIYPKPNLSANNLAHPVFPYLLTNVQINRPNHVWGVDITYIKMHGGFVYLVAFMDWYSRFVVAWKLSSTLEAQFCLEAAQSALLVATPTIINTDQGVQFTGLDFTGLWDQKSTQISMDHRGRCFDNIFTERFWRTLKYEEVYLKDYMTVAEAKQSIGQYIESYNWKRLHQSLGYRTPAELYFSN